jgi:hypothetical protein
VIERNIHHIGDPPSRTCISDAVKNVHTGLWSATFERWRGIPGAEVRVSKITSAPLFSTEQQALTAADRAMDALQTTNMFPNMCEAF